MNERRKEVWVLAGGNGAGKTTFYEKRLKGHGVEFVNADLIEKTLDGPSSEARSYDAAKIARTRFAQLIEAGRSFCYETVFSHESKLEMLSTAKSHGYYVNLAVIHLPSAALNVLRVRQRVSGGGHDVPSDKIRSRIPRTLALVQRAVRQADRSLLFDNGRFDDPFRLIAEREGDEITTHETPLPDWAAEILAPSAS